MNTPNARCLDSRIHDEHEWHENEWYEDNVFRRQCPGVNERVVIFRTASMTEWHLGIGFNTHLADLIAGESAPTAAADDALTAAGLRRVTDWFPAEHQVDRDRGWLKAEVVPA